MAEACKSDGKRILTNVILYVLILVLNLNENYIFPESTAESRPKPQKWFISAVLELAKITIRAIANMVPYLKSIFRWLIISDIDFLCQISGWRVHSQKIYHILNTFSHFQQVMQKYFECISFFTRPTCVFFVPQHSMFRYKNIIKSIGERFINSLKTFWPHSWKICQKNSDLANWLRKLSHNS